jgi:hypothetical protein
LGTALFVVTFPGVASSAQRGQRLEVEKLRLINLKDESEDLARHPEKYDWRISTRGGRPALSIRSPQGLIEEVSPKILAEIPEDTAIGTFLQVLGKSHDEVRAELLRSRGRFALATEGYAGGRDGHPTLVVIDTRHPGVKYRLPEAQWRQIAAKTKIGQEVQAWFAPPDPDHVAKNPHDYEIQLDWDDPTHAWVRNKADPNYVRHSVAVKELRPRIRMDTHEGKVLARMLTHPGQVLWALQTDPLRYHVDTAGQHPSTGADPPRLLVTDQPYGVTHHILVPHLRQIPQHSSLGHFVHHALSSVPPREFFLHPERFEVLRATARGELTVRRLGDPRNVPSTFPRFFDLARLGTNPSAPVAGHLGALRHQPHYQPAR